MKCLCFGAVLMGLNGLLSLSAGTLDKLGTTGAFYGSLQSGFTGAPAWTPLTGDEAQDLKTTVGRSSITFKVTNLDQKAVLSFLADGTWSCSYRDEFLGPAKASGTYTISRNELVFTGKAVANPEGERVVHRIVYTLTFSNGTLNHRLRVLEDGEWSTLKTRSTRDPF
jgi:hypothetical protein